MANKTITKIRTGTAQEYSTGLTQSFNAVSGDFLAVICGGGGASTSAYRPSAVTFNGDSLTKVVESTFANSFAQIWYRLKPDQGTYTVSLTVTTPAGSNWFIPVLFNNVLQASGETDSLGANGQNVSLTVTTAADDLVLDALGIVGGAGHAITGGQTSIANQSRFGASHETAVSGSTTVSWSLDFATDRTYAAAVFNPEPLRSGLICIFGGGYGMGHGGRSLFPGTFAKLKSGLVQAASNILRPTPAQVKAYS